MNAVLESVGSLDRKTYIGSSDVAAILGISPWRTPLDVYLDKVEGRKEITDPAKLKVLNRGTRLEPYVIDMLAEETGAIVVKRGERYRDAEHPFLVAEIDAETADGRNVEIKTVSPFKAAEWGEPDTDEIPLHYTAQIMHALMVRRRDVCVMGVLIGADDFRTYRVERDDETIAAIREKELVFWDRIQRRDPPEATTAGDVLRLYGNGSDKALEATDEIARIVASIKQMKSEAKELDEQIENSSEAVKLYLAECSTLLHNGKPILTWKAQSTKRFDSTRFKVENPGLYDKFVKVSESRTFRLK